MISRMGPLPKHLLHCPQSSLVFFYFCTSYEKIQSASVSWSLVMASILHINLFWVQFETFSQFSITCLLRCLQRKGNFTISGLQSHFSHGVLLSWPFSIESSPFSCFHYIGQPYFKCPCYILQRI